MTESFSMFSTNAGSKDAGSTRIRISVVMWKVWYG